MATTLTKLTLSASPEIIEQARKLSQKSGQSISLMFSEYIKRWHEMEFSPLPTKTMHLGANVIRALEIGSHAQRVPDDWNYKDELADILCEKYGIKD